MLNFSPTQLWARIGELFDRKIAHRIDPHALAPRQSPFSAEEQGELQQQLAPILRELEILRRDTVKRADAWGRVVIPLAGFGMFTLVIRSDDGGALSALLWGIGMAFMSWVVTAGLITRNYVRRFKNGVIPHLIARFGEFSYRHDMPAEMDALRATGLFPRIDNGRVDDHIAGSYRGIALSVSEIELSRKSSGKNKSDISVFAGLHIQIELPRPMAGAVLVVARKHVREIDAEFRRSWRLERAIMESSAFEKEFDVHASDQIEARVLVTPAFMERLMAFDDSAARVLPSASAIRGRLHVAIPRTGLQNLFEPPPFWMPAPPELIGNLGADIARALRIADAVLALDYRTEPAQQSRLD